MLDNVRKAADNIFFRILLAIIALAFVGWGIKDVLNGRNDADLVTFSSARNIPESEFLKAKFEGISYLQKQEKTNFTEEQIKELRIGNIILQQLINERILEDIVNFYELNISNDVAINVIRHSPIFKNDQQQFDVQIFRAAARHAGKSEEEYILNVKKKILQNIVMTIFTEAFYLPEIMVSRIAESVAESRTIDLIEMDLTANKNEGNTSLASDEQLKEIYDANKQLFTVPEKRSLSYIRISNDSPGNQIQVSDEEALTYYNENKDDLGGKEFKKVKAQVIGLVKEQKVIARMIELTKKIEDEIAAGSLLKELAEKYNLEVHEVKYVTPGSIKQNYPYLAEVWDTISELRVGEISYPIELANNQGLLLLALTDVKASKVEEFAEVKDRVKLLWQQEQLQKIRLGELQQIANTYPSNNLKSSELAKKGIKISTRLNLNKPDLAKETHLPMQLLSAIFQTKSGNNTPVLRIDKKAYFAHIGSINIDKKQVGQLKEKIRQHVSDQVKNNIKEELINFFIRQNKTRINFKIIKLQ